MEPHGRTAVVGAMDAADWRMSLRRFPQDAACSPAAGLSGAAFKDPGTETDR